MELEGVWWVVFFPRPLPPAGTVSVGIHPEMRPQLCSCKPGYPGRSDVLRVGAVDSKWHLLSSRQSRCCCEMCCSYSRGAAVLV